MSETTIGVCIISQATVVGAHVAIAITGFTIVFSLTTGIIKKSLSITRNKKKKHDKILMLAKSKLKIIKTLVSKALIEIEKQEDMRPTVRIQGLKKKTEVVDNLSN